MAQRSLKGLQGLRGVVAAKRELRSNRWQVVDLNSRILRQRSRTREHESGVLNTPGRFFRTLGFLWGKKFEILYHFYGKPINDEAISKLLASGQTRLRADSVAGA